MRYPLTFYREQMWRRGLTVGPVTLIRSDLRDDKAVHAHERTHRLWWLVVGLLVSFLIAVVAMLAGWPGGVAFFGMAAHSLFYQFWHKYRERAEIAAVTAGIWARGSNLQSPIDAAAVGLSINYRLKHDADYYRRLLRSEILGIE